MGVLDSLTFTKKAPARAKGGGASPLDKARAKLLADINNQIELARDPNFEVVKPKRDGSETRQKPKSWVVASDASGVFLTIRYSNKPLPIGGKRGSFIRCNVGKVAETLETVSSSVEAGELDDMIEKAIVAAKRGKRKKIVSAN